MRDSFQYDFIFSKYFVLLIKRELLKKVIYKAFVQFYGLKLNHQCTCINVFYVFKTPSLITFPSARRLHT